MVGRHTLSQRRPIESSISHFARGMVSFNASNWSPWIVLIKSSELTFSPSTVKPNLSSGLNAKVESPTQSSNLGSLQPDHQRVSSNNQSKTWSGEHAHETSCTQQLLQGCVFQSDPHHYHISCEQRCGPLRQFPFRRSWTKHWVGETGIAW